MYNSMLLKKKPDLRDTNIELRFKLNYVWSTFFPPHIKSNAATALFLKTKEK